MQSSEVLAEKAASSDPRRETDTELHGYLLVLARAMWIIIAVVAVALSVANLPAGYAQYLTVCTQAVCQNQQATPAMVQALHSAGLTLQFYAIFLEGLGGVAVLVFVAIGAIIAWRKSSDWMGLLVSLALVLFGTVIFTDYQQLATIYPLVQVPGEVLEFLQGVLLLLVAFLFPNGRFVPRWTRWFFLLVVLIEGLGTVFPASPFNVSNLPALPGIAAQLVLIASILFAQVYRYLRVSTPVQRQQTKWVVFGIIATVIYFGASIDASMTRRARWPLSVQPCAARWI